MTYSLEDFQRDFPDEKACYDWLKNYRWPDGIFCENCGKITSHYFIESRKSYSCHRCGHHVHPTANTIFHKSVTPLQIWFLAIYWVAQSQGNIPSRELHYKLGVTYKTAWRMRQLIRNRLNSGETFFLKNFKFPEQEDLTAED